MDVLGVDISAYSVIAPTIIQLCPPFLRRAPVLPVHSPALPRRRPNPHLLHHLINLLLEYLAPLLIPRGILQICQNLRQILILGFPVTVILDCLRQNLGLIVAHRHILLLPKPSKLPLLPVPKTRLLKVINCVPPLSKARVIWRGVRQDVQGCQVRRPVVLRGADHGTQSSYLSVRWVVVVFIVFLDGNLALINLLAPDGLLTRLLSRLERWLLKRPIPHLILLDALARPQPHHHLPRRVPLLTILRILRLPLLSVLFEEFGRCGIFFGALGSWLLLVNGILLTPLLLRLTILITLKAHWLLCIQNLHSSLQPGTAHIFLRDLLFHGLLFNYLHIFFLTNSLDELQTKTLRVLLLWVHLGRE